LFLRYLIISKACMIVNKKNAIFEEWSPFAPKAPIQGKDLV